MISKEEILTALKKAKSASPKRKFLESIELILNLKLDSKKQKFNEAIELPHPDKEAKICLIASSPSLILNKPKVDLILSKEDLESYKGRKKDAKNLARRYNFFIAEGPMMSSVGKVLGYALGPRGKIPIPISPTADVNSIVSKLKKSVLVRMAKDQPVIQCRVGNRDMPDDKLADNILAVLEGVTTKLEGGYKDIGKIYIKTTMGPPILLKA